MALSLSYISEISTDGTEVKFYDTTGIYDASSNTGGWGSPNDDPDEVTQADLVITDANNDTVVTLDVSAAYVALGSSPTVKILLATIPWSYGDGYFKFTLTFAAATALPSNTFTTTNIFLIQTKLAVNTLWKIAFNKGICWPISKDTKEALRAEALYKSIEANQDNIIAADVGKIMDVVNDIIDISNNKELIP